MNLFKLEPSKNIKQRINKINAESKPLWGNMDAAQMFAHCTGVLEVYLGQKEMQVSWLARLFKNQIKQVVFGDKPYKHNLPTVPQFKVTERKEFEKEKKRLLSAIQEFSEMPKAKVEGIVHPLFGRASAEEFGWAMYKHIDHHLQQFGV